jgi:hypothetical protein
VPGVTGRIEAVEFASTVDDTNDLSVVRGASLALLEATRGLSASLAGEFGAGYQEIANGASSLIFRVSSDSGTGADLVSACERLVDAHLSSSIALASSDARMDLRQFRILHAIVDDGAVDKAAPGIKAEARLPVRLAAAEAALRRKQYQKLSAVLTPPGEPAAWDRGGKPCALDQMRPSEVSAGGKTRHSRFTAERLAFGRMERSAFYGRILREVGCLQTAERVDHLDFARSLGDVAPSLQEVGRLGLPVGLANKIAVLHMDGNSFGAALRRLAGDAARLRDASREIRRRQGLLLDALLRFALDTGDAMRVRGEYGERLRLQTLLWGGDEYVFVLPAFAAFDAIAAIENDLQGWKIPGISAPLSHAVGVVFADRKTPIAMLKALADDIVTAAKAGKDKGGAVQAFALESFDAPTTSIQQLRASLFHLSREVAGKGAQFHLSPPGSSFATALQQFRQVLDVVGKSSLHGLVRSGQDAASSGKKVVEALEEQIGRNAHLEGHATLVKALLLDRGRLGFAPTESPLLPTMQILHLHDYLGSSLGTTGT